MYNSELSEDDFAFFQETVDALTGIHLSPRKRDLLKSRLTRRLHELRLPSFSDYRSVLEKLPPGDPEWQLLVNRITTNKTSFYREPAHFSWLSEKYIPEWRNRMLTRPLGIWSAACSTGEEPYSLAVDLEWRHGSALNYRIMATDIDTDALAIAVNGVYSDERLADIPSEARDRFITPGRSGIENWGRVNDAIRKRVQFSWLNLMGGPFQLEWPIDVIFCRNVLIYFSQEAIEKLMHDFHAVAEPGALLCIGHSESLQNLDTPWRYVRPSVFRKEFG